MPTEVQAQDVVGRIVWGHPMQGTEKRRQENGPGWKKGDVVLKQDGTPVIEWAFGLAIPKANFGPLWAAMMAEVSTGFPNGTPRDFSYKFIDGDGIDSDGKPYSAREGYGGCYVLAVKTSAFQPTCVAFENGQYRQLAAQEIKCGDYVAVKLSLKLNVQTGGTAKSSLYVNPVIVQFVGYGKEILKTINAQQALGGVQIALPQGASATPIYTQPPQQPPAYGQPGQMPGQAPAPQGYAPPPMGQPMPGQAPAPQGYAPPPMGQPMPGQAPAPQGYAPPMGQPMPGQAPAPQGYAPPPMQPGQMPGQAPAPQGYAPPPMGQPMPGQMPPPAHDFVNQAGMQQPGQAPAPQGYAPPPMGQPMPGQMPPR